MFRIRSHAVAAVAGTLVLFAASTASAGPMAPTCASLGGVSLAAFVSCTVSGGGPAGQDTLANVQSALDLALDPDIMLDGAASFCTAGTCGGAEFTGTDLPNDFEIDPSTVAGSTGFTFEQIPAGTLFISLKQGNGFEVFKVPGATPFFLEHSLNGTDTSHISTFAAVPEPSMLSLLATVVPVSLALRRRHFAR